MENNTQRTAEDFVYQSENYYFSGRIVKIPKIGYTYLQGGAFTINDQEEKTALGRIRLIIKPGNTKSEFQVGDNKNLPSIADLLQKIISVLNY